MNFPEETPLSQLQRVFADIQRADAALEDNPQPELMIFSQAMMKWEQSFIAGDIDEESAGQIVKELSEQIRVMRTYLEAAADDSFDFAEKALIFNAYILFADYILYVLNRANIYPAIDTPVAFALKKLREQRPEYFQDHSSFMYQTHPIHVLMNKIA
jgi:hypothetical protein